MTTEFLDDFMDGKDKAMTDSEAPPAAVPARESDVGELTLEDRVITAIRLIYDPEIPVNVYDLGLIYGIDIGDDGLVRVDMTLTSPMCPVAEILPQQVENSIRMVDGVTDVELELVWDPPWHPGRLSEETKLELGLL